MPWDFETTAPQVAAALRRMAKAIDEPADILRRAGELLEQQTEQAFSTQGANIGARWPPAVDPERKTDPALLVASGRLRNSITSELVGVDELHVGTDVFYAKFHQFSTVRMQARPFLAVAPAVTYAIAEEFVRGLEDSMSGAP